MEFIEEVCRWLHRVMRMVDMFTVFDSPCKLSTEMILGELFVLVSARAGAVPQYYC